MVAEPDREHAIATLKVAFVQDRLTKGEFDARIDRALAARTYAELATVTADIPAWLVKVRPPRTPSRWRRSNAVRWVAFGAVTPALLAVAFAVISQPGGSGYGAVTFVIALGYFLFWLSAGAEMLWQWHCLSLPTAALCVRCAHTAASHRAPASCTVRLTSRRCPCAGYVPPGHSPPGTDPQLMEFGS